MKVSCGAVQTNLRESHFIRAEINNSLSICPPYYVALLKGGCYIKTCWAFKMKLGITLFPFLSYQHFESFKEDISKNNITLPRTFMVSMSLQVSCKSIFNAFEIFMWLKGYLLKSITFEKVSEDIFCISVPSSDQRDFSTFNAFEIFMLSKRFMGIFFWHISFEKVSQDISYILENFRGLQYLFA